MLVPPPTHADPLPLSALIRHLPCCPSALLIRSKDARKQKLKESAAKMKASQKSESASAEQ